LDYNLHKIVYLCTNSSKVLKTRSQKLHYLSRSFEKNFVLQKLSTWGAIILFCKNKSFNFYFSGPGMGGGYR